MVKMFQEKMAGEGNDPDDLIVQAFKAYDNEGKIDSKMFEHALKTWGDKMTKAEIDDIFGEFEIDEDYMIKTKDVISLFVAVKEEPKAEEPPPVEEAPVEEEEDADAKKKRKTQMLLPPKMKEGTIAQNCSVLRQLRMKLLSNLILSNARIRILLMKSRISLTNSEKEDALFMIWISSAVDWKQKRRSCKLP